jgi:hypothetical protein
MVLVCVINMRSGSSRGRGMRWTTETQLGFTSYIGGQTIDEVTKTIHSNAIVKRCRRLIRFLSLWDQEG